MTSSRPVRTVALTTVAMIAFAANSVLARVALLGGTIDAASFTTLRLATGAAALLLLTGWPRRRSRPAGAPEGRSGSWKSACMLFLYAAPFSFAYLGLTTGTGALILFGLVQITMIAGGLLSGERPGSLQWLGLALALLGLVYLMLPGVSAPPVGSAALMAVAGFSWGIYSLWGRGSPHPLAETTGNFARSIPLVLVLSLATLPGFRLQLEGALLAMASGALASGLGYVIWYAALRSLTATKAAVVQLSVPILAAAGGTVFLAEPVTLRLVLSALLTLGGIALAVLGRPGDSDPSRGEFST